MKSIASNSRRKFISTLALGASAGVTAMAMPFKEAIEKTPILPVNGAEEWFNKIKGKHRVVFDGSEPNSAFSMIWTWAYYLTNNSTGTPDSDQTAVCVFRHNAAPFALNDALWSKYKLGEMFNIEDNRTKKPATRNAYYDAKDGDFILNGVEGISAMQKRGALFCVCGLALSVYSGFAAAKLGLDPEAVKKEWMDAVLPGIQIVPAGIWALGRAQEHGCSYIFAG